MTDEPTPPPVISELNQLVGLVNLTATGEYNIERIVTADQDGVLVTTLIQVPR